jgi:hypothetical protein
LVKAGLVIAEGSLGIRARRRAGIAGLDDGTFTEGYLLAGMTAKKLPAKRSATAYLKPSAEILREDRLRLTREIHASFRWHVFRERAVLRRKRTERQFARLIHLAERIFLLFGRE